MDPELDPSSGAEYIQANRRAAITQAVTSLDADPEAAARSMELSQATGVPAPVINGNLENFEQQHKASLTTQLLNNNDYLRSYINANPMAAKVSNDDYAQLDAVSSSVSKMKMGFGSRMAETAKNSFWAMLKPPDNSDLAESISSEDLKNHPIASAVYAGLGTPINMLLQGMQEDIHGLTEGALKAGTAIGGEQFGRDIAGMAEAEVMGMSGRHGGPEVTEGASRAQAAGSLFKQADLDKAARIRPYIENGREPLPTILPEYDDFRAKQNAEDVDALKEATSEAQQSLTRERAPDMFRGFIAQHTDAEIGVSGDAVSALYGDKVPTPDDGLLGWVPGIEDKLALARETGSDVSIPLADWLTHAEPEVMQALHDDLRVRPGGITANEVKAESEAKAEEEAIRNPPMENPVTGFHGSRDVISQFDPAQTRLDRGVFFAQKPELASKFAEGRMGDGDPARIYGEDSPEEIDRWIRQHAGDTEADRIGKMVKEADKLDWEDDKKSELATKINGEIGKLTALDQDYGTSAPNVSQAHIDLGKTYEADLGGKFDWDKEREAINHAKDNGFNSVTFKNAGVDGDYYTVFDKGQVRPTVVGSKGPIPEDVPSFRAATALEPLYSIGDRKLALERLKGTEGAMFGPAQGFHDFSINDENGNPVGTLNLSEQRGGKDIYVEMINGIGGLGPRDFGPALMRDIKRQVKAEFPNAERIGGHRVSGMREKFGTEMGPTSSVWVKLDKLGDDDFQDLKEVLEGGQWETYSPNIQAYIKPDAMRSEADRELVRIVNEEADRIAPKKTAVQVVDTIKAKTGGIEGQRADEDIKVGGAYIRYKETYPIILAALDSKDTLGTFRHEVVHHLRQYGFFDNEEWSTLEAQALAGGWLSKYRIDQRYPTANPELKLEEAIADAYPDWKRRQEALKQRADQIALPPSPLDAIFQKMKDFFDAIRERVSALFGKDATWEDVFKRVDTGEVGGREGTQPLDARAFNEKLSNNVDQFRRAANDNISDRPATGNKITDQIIDKFFEDSATLEKPSNAGANHAAWISKLDSIGKQINDILNTPDLSEFDRARVKKLEEIYNRIPDGGEGSLDPKLSIEEPTEGGSRVFERASALGMTVDQFKAYEKLIQKRNVEDIAAAQKRIDDFQRKTQTKEWKDNRRELRQEISKEIHQRPDVAADLFFATGELYGQKISTGYKLDTDQLSPEQRAAIPKDYQARGGLNPDDVANIFGYGSGDAMLQRLAEYNAAKKASGLGAKDFVARVTDAEADRQMRIKYGVLEDNIVDSVKEQVASETQLDILHEETHKLGMEVGQAPLDKGTVLKAIRDQFSKVQLGSFSSDRYLATAGKAGRAAELALLKNDPAEAFKAKQQQYFATAMANEAIKTENQLNKAEKLWKKFGRPFDPKKGNIDADYSLMIRSILSQIERPYGMSIQGMEKAIGDSGYKGLADFVEKQDAQYSLSGIKLPVADLLLDPGFHKKVEDLTVDEFNAVNESIIALNKFGREIEKVTIAGEKADRRAVITDMAKQLEEKFEPQDFGATGKPGAARTYLAALTNTETLFARFDGRDPNGLFTKTFTYPAAEAANGKDVMTREFSKAYPKDIANPKKLVDSPLIDPLTGKKLTQFTRENVATIISNMGNDYNWRVFTKGWGIDPDVLRAWVEKNSTPEDFDRAQALGDLFTKGKGKSDVVYKNIYGIASENIQVKPFTMHGKEYPGWYHPIIYDPIRSKLSKLQGANPAEGAHSNFWPSVSNVYTKRRTGNVDVISLSQDMVKVKLNQMLHDIAFRDFVHNTAKITRDDAFRRAITKSYGPEYVEVIDKWLERIAGNASYNSTALAMATRISGRLRQNVVNTYIAFSPTTVEKHGPTAAIMSMKEVGVGKFARITAEVAADSFKHAVAGLFGKSEGLGDSLWQFVKKHSEEIQRRDRNFEDTLGGAADLAVGRSTLRNRITQWGAKAVAFSDMISAVPLWLAKYDEVVNETGDHGMAVQQADRAVRRAHGSTAITNQPLIVSNSGPLAPWLTSIYGFFGTNMQRRIEIAHDINDAYKLGKQGEIGAAAKAVPQIMSSIFTYVIWPGIVEEAVTSQFTDDKRGALAHALAFTLGTAASTFIGIRDLMYGLTHGQDPQAGLMSSPLHDVSNLIRDAKKNHPLDKQNAGKLVEDAVTVFGDATGMGPKHVGAAARYGMDVWNKQQRPKTAGDVYRGVVSGNQSKRTER